MIVTIHRDGKHVADLCNKIRDRMFPDVKMDTSRPEPEVKAPEPKRRKRKA